MSEVAISVQVHALQPNWIEHEKPKYRLYVNDDLISERTWIWNMQTCIEEDVRVEVSPGVNHTIRLEIIKNDRMHLAQFGLQNLRIDGQPKPDHGGHRSELSFILA